MINSQNELDIGNLTAIQLVNYLRISHLQKNFHTLLFEFNSNRIFPRIHLLTAYIILVVFHRENIVFPLSQKELEMLLCEILHSIFCNFANGIFVLNRHLLNLQFQ